MKKTNDLKKINWIKRLRIENNLSQEELSENSGVSLRTIQRLENNESEAREQTLLKLADVFGVDYKSILESDEKVENKTETETENKIKNSWLINVSFVIIGANIGYLIALFLHDIIDHTRAGEFIFFSLITLFGAIGFVISNIYVIKKLNRK